jgi:hypothetical protein
MDYRVAADFASPRRRLHLISSCNVAGRSCEHAPPISRSQLAAPGMRCAQHRRSRVAIKWIYCDGFSRKDYRNSGLRWLAKSIGSGAIFAAQAGRVNLPNGGVHDTNPKLKSAFVEMPPSNFPEGTVSDLQLLGAFPQPDYPPPPPPTRQGAHERFASRKVVCSATGVKSHSALLWRYTHASKLPT